MVLQTHRLLFTKKGKPCIILTRKDNSQEPSMKHIRSLIIKIKTRLTLKTYQKPLVVTLLVLFGINLLVLFIGSLIAMAIDASVYNNSFFGGHFIEAFLGCAKWLVSPHSLTAMNTRDSWQMMILAILMVFIGLVLFSGVIIATVTNALRAYIDKKSQAKGKILVENHFVILNWNSKVPDMVYNLMLKGYKENIVIVSNRDKEYIESEVKSLFLANEIQEKIKAKLIVKQGDSLLRANLEDISIENAAHICIMAREDMNDGDDQNIHNADLLNLKILLRLGSFKINPDCQIVVETDSDLTRGQMENLSYTIASLKELSITPVSFNRKIGQIIAQSIVMPQMSEVYSYLFSFSGAEFYSLESEEEIDSFLKTHDNAIPVFKADRLFALAENEKESLLTRKEPICPIVPLKPNLSYRATADSVFIIGDNSKSEFVLENLRRSQEFGEISFKIKHYHKNENALLISDLKATPGPKTVLILSDDSVGMESYDANVFVTLIELSKAFHNKENITFITELLDSRNLSSVHDFNIKNTIISNRMMSLLLTQIVMNKDSKAFFNHLLSIADAAPSKDDFDLLIGKASDLLEMGSELHFQSKAELLRSFYEAFKGKCILIGLIQSNGSTRFLNQEQDKEEEIIVTKDESFIYFRYH